MSILYPLDKPVTAEDIRTKASELLAREGEWTPWEAVVLNAVAKHAEQIHGHYMRHVWYELEDLGEPDLQAARDDVLAATDHMFSIMEAAHACESLLHADTDRDLDEIEANEAGALLVIHAAALVDDLVESLRRGPCAIVDRHLHGFELSEWAEILRFEDEQIRLPSVDEAVKVLTFGLVEALDAPDDIDLQQAARDAKALNARNQGLRNVERVKAAVELTNQNYRIPETFSLRIASQDARQVVLLWGASDPAPDGTEELVTRPSGRDVVQLQTTSLGEVHPMAIADIARSGRFAALSVGRDAEIRSAGGTLQEPPIWAWAGPMPVIRHVLARLRAGEDVDVTRGGLAAGPLLSAKAIQLGDGAAVYAYNARTLDETLTLYQSIPDTLAHACIGNPLSVIIQAPIFEGGEVTIQACDADGEVTDFDLISPVVRLQPAPSGYEQDPETAWLGMLEGFDEQAVYGDRIYRRVDDANGAARIED